jgi:uncharacterized sulfatase
MDAMKGLSRRDFLPLLAAPALNARAAARRPNFVIFFADDLGYGDLGCFGSQANKTPQLDRMAREGARFTDFYVPMPFCAPTRSSLLTGRYPFRTGVTGNPAPDAGINDIGLPAEEVTIAEALQPLGYASMCIGKWHLGHVPPFLPRTQGFDEYYGILYSNDMRPVQLVHNEKVAAYPVMQGQLTQDYTQRALRFIEQNRERPFFLYLPHAMPHKPLAASEDFYTPGRPADLYASVVAELDWSVGQILARLKQLGLDENTLVLFSSDNGPWFGGSTGGLRGMKGSNWEGGTRVPMIARWPGRIPAGHTCREVSGVIDFFPTLVNLAGGQPPAGRVLDGRDITPLMASPGSRSPHEAMFFMSGPELRAVRSGRWKLHVRAPAPGAAYLEDASKWVDPRGPDGVTIIAQHEQARPDQYPGLRTGDPPKSMMLFDLDNDPGEQRDVAARHPEVVQRLKAAFDRMDAEAAQAARRARQAGPGKGIIRLKGGELRYDLEPKGR